MRRFMDDLISVLPPGPVSLLTQAKLDAAAAAAATAFHVCPNYEVLVKALLQYGPEELQEKCVR